MSEDRPRARLVVDVVAYALARLLLVVVLTAVIFGVAHLLGVATSRSSSRCCSRS